MNMMAIGNGGNVIPRDAATLASLGIDYAHREIHNGNHYNIADFITLADTVVLDFTVQTPDTTKWAHLLFSLQATQLTQIDVHEAITESGGTPVTPINNDRNSSNVSALIIKTGATVTDTGDRISGQKFGVAGTPVTSRGGETRRDDEFILKQNTKYLFRITSGGDGNIVSYRAFWYEHTNKG